MADNDQRLALQAVLVALLGSTNVYFQPPPNITLDYPCIIYNRSDINVAHADNGPYKAKKQYEVISIDRNPDSETPSKLSMLPLCSYDRFYTADNLNHDVFTLFF